MNDGTHQTRSGKTLTDVDIDRLADTVASYSYDIEESNAQRRRGRVLNLDTASTRLVPEPPGTRVDTTNGADR